MKNCIFYLFLSLSTVICNAQPQATPAAASTSVMSWTCNAFYLPARSIWRRTIDLEYDAQDVRSVKIDGLAVYTFSVTGTQILTAVDGERIQFDAETRTWRSDLRGIVSSEGLCEQ